MSTHADECTTAKPTTHPASARETLVRPIARDEAEALVALRSPLDGETDGPSFAPGERAARPAMLRAALEACARGAGLDRLEPTVRADDRRASALHERAGFACEGVRRGAPCLGSRACDELYTAKPRAAQGAS